MPARTPSIHTTILTTLSHQLGMRSVASFLRSKAWQALSGCLGVQLSVADTIRTRSVAAIGQDPLLSSIPARVQASQ